MKTEGASQLFETQKRGRVMQIYARDHVEVHSQKKKEVLYLVKKQNKKQEQRKIMDINCEVLLQEFNKYLVLFIYNNAMDQLMTICRLLLPIVKNSSSFSIPNIFSNTKLQSGR